MCVVIAKYFSGTGWVGVKNRDRNYVPDLSFRKKQNKNTVTVDISATIKNIEKPKQFLNCYKTVD